MKLDRNNNPDGKGKYALIKLRNYPSPEAKTMGIVVAHALSILEKAGMLDYGNQGTESEFFVIRLKDKYAKEALWAYGNEADKDDQEYAADIFEMAKRSGDNSPFCKKPD